MVAKPEQNPSAKPVSLNCGNFVSRIRGPLLTQYRTTQKVHGSPHSSTSFARHAHSISSSSVRSVIPTRFSGGTLRFPSSYSRWSTSRRGVPSPSWPPDYPRLPSAAEPSKPFSVTPQVFNRIINFHNFPLPRKLSCNWYAVLIRIPPRIGGAAASAGALHPRHTKRNCMAGRRGHPRE